MKVKMRACHLYILQSGMVQEKSGVLAGQPICWFKISSINKCTLDFFRQIDVLSAHAMPVWPRPCYIFLFSGVSGSRLLA